MKQAVLELRDIHKTFGQGTANENRVLKGINLELFQGDFTTVIGGNGAGKSTTMNIIAGALQPDQGQVLIDGQTVNHLPTSKRAKEISRVFQDTKMGTASRLTIEENLAIANRRGLSRSLVPGVRDRDRQMLKDRLKVLELGLENRLTTEVAYLSGGQRQALTLLMATLRKPRLLLLDEHTAALDPRTSKMVLEITDRIVREEEITTLMITHNMEDAIRMGNRLIMLHQGQVILNVSGAEKEALTVNGLVELFQQRAGQALTDDSVLLS